MNKTSKYPLHAGSDLTGNQEISGQSMLQANLRIKRIDMLNKTTWVQKSEAKSEAPVSYLNHTFD